MAPMSLNSSPRDQRWAQSASEVSPSSAKGGIEYEFKVASDQRATTREARPSRNQARFPADGSAKGQPVPFRRAGSRRPVASAAEPDPDEIQRRIPLGESGPGTRKRKRDGKAPRAQGYFRVFRQIMRAITEEAKFKLFIRKKLWRILKSAVGPGEVAVGESKYSTNEEKAFVRDAPIFRATWTERAPLKKMRGQAATEFQPKPRLRTERAPLKEKRGQAPSEAQPQPGLKKSEPASRRRCQAPGESKPKPGWEKKKKKSKFSSRKRCRVPSEAQPKPALRREKVSPSTRRDQAPGKSLPMENQKKPSYPRDQRSRISNPTSALRIPQLTTAGQGLEEKKTCAGMPHGDLRAPQPRSSKKTGN